MNSKDIFLNFCYFQGHNKQLAKIIWPWIGVSSEKPDYPSLSLSTKQEQKPLKIYSFGGQGERDYHFLLIKYFSGSFKNSWFQRFRWKVESMITVPTGGYLTRLVIYPYGWHVHCPRVAIMYWTADCCMCTVFQRNMKICYMG